LTAPHKKKLELFHLGCIRWITGITRRKQHADRISNVELLRISGMSCIEEHIRRRQLRWIGHVARMTHSALPKQLLFGWSSGRVPGAWNATPRYRESLLAALQSRGVSPHAWLGMAQDRDLWRRVVRNTHAHPVAAPLPVDAPPAPPPPLPADGEAGEVIVDGVVCPVPGCGKVCKGAREVSRHVQLVHPEGTEREQGMPCPHCPYIALNCTTLSKHVNHAHAEGNVVCSFCQMHFRSAERLHVHRVREHRPLVYTAAEADGKWACPHCEVRTPTVVGLIRHRNTHNHW
jgi:uncharacterized Zn-finger protein